MFNYDCESRDALSYIERELHRNQSQASAENDAVEKWLYEGFLGQLFPILVTTALTAAVHVVFSD